jgi:hypothetical protein
MSAVTAMVGEPYAGLLRSATDASAKGLLGVQMPVARGWGRGPQGKRPDYDWHEHHKGHGHRHHDECGCGSYEDCECRPCRRDDCHCRCCIVDADLVVHARLFERRLVPILLENDRRREKEVDLDLSEFKTRGGSRTSIVASVTPTTFVLGPCEEREIVVAIEVRGEQPDEGAGDTKDTEAKPKAGASKQVGEPARTIVVGDREVELIDVDECIVAYGDLRFSGCDIRPLRIAVSVLPRDCHAYRLRCSCGCC